MPHKNGIEPNNLEDELIQTELSDQAEKDEIVDNRKKYTPETIIFRIFLILLIFASGFGSGFMVGDGKFLAGDEPASYAEIMEQVNPSEGFQLSVSYHDLGPKLIQAGVIDPEKFISVFDLAGKPLDDHQKNILTQGSNDLIVIDQDSAYFMLNFFWALGLANQNPILTEGPMIQNGGASEVGRFASTGGWVLSVKPILDIYASVPLIQLTEDQQKKLENVTQKIYRPCCNNPVYFPDCNHGMAMLGLLTLLAADDASESDLFEAAKYVNAYWYPTQNYEIAVYFNAVDGQSFDEINSELVVSKEFSSGTGFSETHQYLVANNLLEKTPGTGNSCGV